MKRAKTETLPGVPNGKIIKEISDAAEEYENVRDRRMELTEEEKELNDKLVELMRKHKLKAYRDSNYDPPLTVTLSAKDPTIKAKVKRDKAEED